jgi:hypothetical protein
MSRSAFTQADVARAVAGALKAGAPLAAAEIDRQGRIRLIFRNHESPITEDDDLDEELRNWRAGNGDG